MKSPFMISYINNNITYQANKAIARIITIMPANNPAKNTIVISNLVGRVELRRSTQACSVIPLYSVGHW